MGNNFPVYLETDKSKKEMIEGLNQLGWKYVSINVITDMRQK